jgi:hypothetical protein
MTTTEPRSARQPARRRPRRPPEAKPGIQRRNYGLNHGYRVDGVKWPGVTTISGLLKGQGLMDYTGKVVSRYAVNNWDELGELAPATRLDRLYEARWAERDAAAGRGTQIHKLGAKLAHGEEIDVPDALRGHVEAYVGWLDRFEPRVLATELVVANREHRYCGTLDLLADLGALIAADEEIPPGRWLLDLKSSRSGIWPETALQVNGYAEAEVFVHPDTAEEVPIAELGIDYLGAVSLKSDAASLVPLSRDPEVFECFAYLAAVWWRNEHRMEWLGAPAEPLGPPPEAPNP